MNEPMLEAHVDYAMAQLTDGLERTVEAEAEALFAWFDTVTLSEIVDPEALSVGVARAIREVPRDELANGVAEALRHLRSALAGTPETVGDLISQADAVRWATELAAMREARDELLTQLTSSPAYSRLVAHVVYNGVKSYLLTENVLTKRIPGASSLVRLGQRGLGAAAPGLEQNVDRQLIAFVDANIADTVRESRRFIERMLDDATVAQSAAHGWAAVADRPVAAFADVLADADVETLAELAWAQWTSLRATPLVEQVATGVVHGYVESHAEDTVGALLADTGITASWVSDWLTPLVAAVLEKPAVRAYAEQRVRNQLAGFYATYQP
jgi:hypothetical protein